MDEVAAEYWRSGRGIPHIKPPDSKHPEGEWFTNFIAGLGVARSVLDYGCGIGRLARAFSARMYVGVDICPEALRLSKKYNPEYRFEELADELPAAELTLCHTVLLHVSDAELSEVIGRFTSPLVVVSEILGRNQRRAGDPPVFNREYHEYRQAFAAAGYRYSGRIELNYPHYDDTKLSVMVFKRGTTVLGA